MGKLSSSTNSCTHLISYKLASAILDGSTVTFEDVTVHTKARLLVIQPFTDVYTGHSCCHLALLQVAVTVSLTGPQPSLVHITARIPAQHSSIIIIMHSLCA